MASIFDKWDKEVNGAALAEEVKEIEQNSSSDERDYEEVPYGQYEVKIEKMELKNAKSGAKMFSCWFKIVEDKNPFKGQLIFMNQVIEQPFQIHIVDEFLKSLDSGVNIEFDGKYSHYNNLILEVIQAIAKQKLEYLLDYSQNKKGYNQFKIEEVFEA